MDATQIGIVATSLSVAKDIAKAMVGVRDFNLVADRIAALNDQLLKAQEALLAHNAAMFQLQNEKFEACEELRKLKEAASERSRYTLFEIAPGNFVYRMNVGPQESGTGEPSAAEPMHHLCQPCFDNGRKVVLGMSMYDYGSTIDCPVCHRSLTYTDRR